MKFEGDPGGDPDPGGGGGGGDPAPVALVDHEGKFTEKYLEHFDEGDRGTLERFKETGLKSMGKSYADLQRQFRSPDDFVKMPKEDSSDEEKAAFHKRRGVPDEAKDYPKYEIPEVLTNVSTSDEEQEYYNNLFKKANLTPAQRKIMADGHYEYLNKFLGDAAAKDQEARDQAFDAADIVLNRKFGSGQAKDQRILRANAIMRHYGGEEAVASLNAENNPFMTLFLDRIAQDMAPARIEGIMKGSSSLTPTNTDIDQKMADLRKKPGYFDRNHPDYQSLMKQRESLTLQRTA
jgi:hypothetical protein